MLYVGVRASGKADGRLEVLTDDLRKTLNDTDTTLVKLKKLNQQKVDLTARIAAEAATRTKPLEENLSDEEVLRRLKEQGIVK